MKLIHCADIHLDSPMLTHMSAAQASMRNAQIIDSFLRLTDYAAANGVRAVIIAGDLFDGERVRGRTVDEILAAMERTPEVDYLYLRQFGSEWTTFQYKDAAISGVRLCRENGGAIYETVPHVEGCVNIAVLHGQIGTVSGEDAVNLNLLKNKGIDYLALGHIHSYALERLDRRGVYCYCGCLEGRGFDECGDKGFVLLDVEDGRVTPAFVPFASRRLHRIPVDITGLTKSTQIAQAMKQAVREISAGDMVEFLLTGSCEPDTDLSLPYLRELMKSGFSFVKVKDETTCSLDPDRYKNDVSLKGAFIRLVMAGGEDDADKTAIIRAGLQALAGEEIGL